MATPKLTPLSIAILGLLHEKPMHPYEMTQLMRDRNLDIRVNVKTGSLYHTVERLEKAEYIRVAEVLKNGRRPERTVYAMTEAGRDAYVERAKTMVGTLAPEYPEYVSALALLHDLDPTEALEQLRYRSLRLAGKTAAFAASIEELKKQDVPEIYWLDWQFLLAKHEFELQWNQKLIQEIEAGRLQWPPERRQLPESTPTNLALVRKNHEHQAS